MKFLVFMKAVRAPAPENPIAVLQAAKEHLNAKLADGTLDCIYNVVGTMGMAIVNADSHEELTEQLMAYPQYPFGDFEVHALGDANHFFDKTIEMMQKMGGG